MRAAVWITVLVVVPLAIVWQPLGWAAVVVFPGVYVLLQMAERRERQRGRT